MICQHHRSIIVGEGEWSVEGEARAGTGRAGEWQGVKYILETTVRDECDV